MGHAGGHESLRSQGPRWRAVGAEAAVIVLVIAAALAARRAVTPLLGDGLPFVTMFPAVAALGWWRGARTGVPGLLLAWLSAMYFFMEPRGSLVPAGRAEWAGSVLFLIAGGLIVLLSEHRRHALVRAERGDRDSALLAAIVESSEDAIISKTLEGNITSWNAAARRLYGYTAAEAVGRPITLIVPPDRHHEEAEILARIERGERLNHLRTVRIAKDGHAVNVLLTVSPIRDAAGRVVGASKIAKDITQELAAQAALRESEQRFRVMADSASVLVWMAGPDALRTWFSRGWLDYTGRDLEQERGNGWVQSVHPDDREACVRAYRDAIASQRGYRAEFRLRRFDGEYRWFIDSGAPLLDERAGFTGFIGSCMDIHERKQAEQQREEILAGERAARAEAERLSRVKDDFVATLSHELRTPLNAILGWSQLIRRPAADTAEVHEGLEIIERNARAQSQMIEDLLDMSRIVSGKLRLDVQRVNLLKVVEQAVASARPAAEGKNIRLQTVLDPRTNLVNGDPTRLQQIVWNLLTNAIKFTPKGGRVQVVLRRVNSSVCVSVSDTGKGIRPEFLGELFQRFRQEDSSTTRRFSGLGLGLAIVKHLTELHGGTVTAASEGEGRGATFTVELPLAVLHPRPEPPAPDEVQPVQASAVPLRAPVLPDLTGVSVLVVEDESDARGLIHRILGDCGARVTVAESVSQALNLFASTRPDVILSDIGMAEQDGYELIRAIRSLPSHAGGATPAAALTALARSEDRTRALLAGFQVHVAKPIEPSELVAVVVSLAKLKVRESGGDGQVAQSPQG